MAQLSISAKNLGSFAMADSCPRCLWMQIRMGFKMPYQIFPGIFSSIDSYTKRVVNFAIVQSGGSPEWLAPLGEIRESLPTPGFKRFNTLFEEYDIRLTGALDALYLLADETLCVADYKTAKFTENQDTLAPMYAVQLNGYAEITNRLGMGNVSKLGLIYFEPQTSDQDCVANTNQRENGFAMGFSAHVSPVELNPQKWLYPYLDQARRLADMQSIPTASPGCKNCPLMDQIVALANP